MVLPAVLVGDGSGGTIGDGSGTPRTVPNRSILCQQYLNLRSRLPARSGQNRRHRRLSPSAPERGRSVHNEVVESDTIMPTQKYGKSCSLFPYFCVGATGFEPATSASRRIGGERQGPAYRTNHCNSYIKFISYRLFYRLFLF